MWKMIAVVVFVIGSTLPAFVNFPIPALAVQALGLVFSLTIYTLATRFLLRGRRLMASSAEDVLARDHRPPVIYLRSFKDDPTTARTMMGAPIGWAFLFGVIETEEEMLASSLSEIGPVITIGRPGEELRELGAARMYADEAEWHQKVDSLITSARLVVLRLGQTEGFWWEVEESLRKMNPHQLLVFVPYIKDRQAREMVRTRAEALFPKPLPEFVRSDKRGGILGSLRGYLYFDLDWTAHYKDLTRKQWTLRTLPRFLGFGKPRVTLKYGLRPVFDQIGVPWTDPPVRWLGTIITGAAVSFLVLVFLVLLIALMFAR